MDAIICKQSVTVTKCKHVFHTNCLKNWTTNFNTTCPLCRAQIVQKRPIVTSSEQIHALLREILHEIETTTIEIEIYAISLGRI
jgi:hypothetical protein